MRLSIITVNLNNKAGLEATARSVAAQRGADCEWIVIDGGSTDGSVEVIERYASHISHWVSEPDTGVYNAMNKGVAAARGRYLHFLNSGDCYADDSVAADFCRWAPEAEVVYGDVRRVDSRGAVVAEDVYPQSLSLWYFLDHNICQQAIFYARDCFERVRFSEDLRLYSDYEFNTRMYLGGRSFAHWPRLVALYNVDGLSSTLTGLTESEKKTFQDRMVPSGVLNEYRSALDRLYMLQCAQSNDLMRMTHRVAKSNWLCRNLLRVFLYPVYLISKITSRQ